MYFKSLLTAVLAITGTAAFVKPASATVIFNETFEPYALGNSNGQGGWVDFGGDLTANIVNTIANGGSQSIAFATEAVPPAANQYGSDSTLDLGAPITSGQLLLSFDIFQPSNFDGVANIFISRGPTLTGTFDGGLNLQGNGILGTFRDANSPTTPLIVDRWVSVLININLDANTATASYGGTQIFNGAWNNGGATPNQYQGLNIWADGSGANAAAFNIDNLRLETIPEPGGVTLLGLGMLGLTLRRRRS
jgi:hypothetical protein